MRKNIGFAHALRVLPLAASLVGQVPAQEDQPTIAKDSLQVTAYTFNVYHKSFDTWSWAPGLQFRVNGPIASGSQLYAEFAIPGGPPVKFDCKTGETKQGAHWKTECGARDIPEDKGTTYTGMVDFSIHMRNELAGGDKTLFTGKAKVVKAHSNEHGPKVANHFVYYVDQDWNLPIGYIFTNAAPASEGDRTKLSAAFWYRGDQGIFEPHMFYQGKEVGKITFERNDMGKASCSTAEIEDTTTHFVEDSLPQKAKWTRVICHFPNVMGRDNAKIKPLPGQVGAPHVMKENPGDYEIKVIWNNHLSRSIKFTVTPDGKFDNGIASANKLGVGRIIVPVQIIGDQDGQWDKSAWKTDAFYGNPLSGFTAVP